jgi:hypothetical protein
MARWRGRPVGDAAFLPEEQAVCVSCFSQRGQKLEGRQREGFATNLAMSIPINPSGVSKRSGKRKQETVTTISGLNTPADFSTA